MYNAITTTDTYTDRKTTVDIVKFQKEGTKRVFFAPTVDGLRITRTMFARKTGAVDLAKKYIAAKAK